MGNTGNSGILIVSRICRRIAANITLINYISKGQCCQAIYEIFLKKTRFSVFSPMTNRGRQLKFQHIVNCILNSICCYDQRITFTGQKIGTEMLKTHCVQYFSTVSRAIQEENKEFQTYFQHSFQQYVNLRVDRQTIFYIYKYI